MLRSLLILICIMPALSHAVSFNSVEAMRKFGWQIQGGAVLQAGRASDGTFFPRAEGNGIKNYGGLRLNANLNFNQAGEQDYLFLKLRQNIDSGLYILLRNTRDIVFCRSFKVPLNSWTEVRLPLKLSEWPCQGSVTNVSNWGQIQQLSIYHEALKKEGLYLEISDFKIMIGGQDIMNRSNVPAGTLRFSELKDSSEHKLFQTSEAVYLLDRRKGNLSGVWRRKDGVRLVERTETFYHLQSRSGDNSASDLNDQVVDIAFDGKNFVLNCRNPALPDLQIKKSYYLEENRLIRRLQFTNQRTEKIYLTPSTEMFFNSDFRQDSYYFGGSFLGPLLSASSISKRERVSRFNNSAKAMVLSNSETGKGSFSNYRRKLGEIFLFPWWTGAIGNYVEYPNQLYYTPEGWDLAYGTLSLEPNGGINSSEDVFLFFQGTWFDFLDRIYASDPEAKEKLAGISAPPAWLGNILMQYGYYRDGKAGLQQILKMTNEGYIMVLFDLSCNWADYRVEKNGLDGYWGGHINGSELKAFIKQLQALSPRIKVGLYQFVSSVLKSTPLSREHPEWFRKHDKEGNEAILFPGVPMNYTSMVNRPELRQELLNQFRNVKEYLGVDFIYLDETKAISQIDWDSGELLHENDWYKLWEGMRELAAEFPDLPLFFNGRANPFGDINFIEAGHQLHPSKWRDFAGMVFASEFFLKNRPGARISLLYWHAENDYVNRVLALGLIPEKEVDRPLQRCMPFINAVYEIGDIEPVDMTYAPDWKKDSDTQIESYAVSRLNGQERICSFINRDASQSQVTIALNLAEYQDTPITIWQYLIAADKASRNPLTYQESAEAYRESGWRENVITTPALCYYGIAPAEFKSEFAIPHGQMLQLVISTVPAGIYTRNGIPQNYFFSHNRGFSIEGQKYPLEVSCTLESAEIILPFAAQITVDGKAVSSRSMWLGKHLHSIVAIAKGNSRVDAKELPQPSEHAVITARVEGKWIQANGAGVYALSRNGNTVYTGPAPIPLPDKRLGGEYDIQALHADAISVPITLSAGEKSCAWQITHGSRRPATKQLQIVRRPLGNGEILQAATATSDSPRIWEIQPEVEPFITSFDAETATLTAGTSRKIEDYLGSAFAGFELRNIQQIQLELQSSFATAVSRESRYPHITAWRRSSREFAGIIVDFRCAGEYRKRVALSLGVRHKDCNTGNPVYGKGGKPDLFIDFGNHLETAKTDLVLDLRQYAPEDWDGTAWFSIGTDWIAPGRQISARILAVNADCRAQSTEESESARLMIEARQAKKMCVHFLKDFAITEGFDSPAWPEEPQVKRFFQLGSPVPAKMQTQARVAYDAVNLYFSIRCHETLRQKPISGKNQIWENDDIEIFLSPGSGRVYQFLLDGSGKRALLKAGKDLDPEGIQSKITFEPGQYWDVEVILPFAKINAEPEGEWEFNLCRSRLPGNGLPGEHSSYASLGSRYFSEGEVAKLTFTTRKSRQINFGKPGGNSADLLQNVIPKVLAFKPDLCVAMVGTNDALNSNKLIEPEQYEKNLRQMIQTLQTAGSAVLLINLPPCVEEILFSRHKKSAYGDTAPGERIKVCNQIIASLAQQYQLPLVNFYQIMMKRGDLAGATSLLRNLVNVKSSDGVHPTAEAYRLLAEAVAESIHRNKLPCARIACLGDSITYGAHMRGASSVSGETYPGQLSYLLQ